MFDQLAEKINHLDRRIRLVICIVISVIIFCLFSRSFSYAIDFMISWIGFSAGILLFSWFTMITSHPREISDIPRQQDERQTVIFLVVVIAAFISLFAIIILLQNIPRESKKGFSTDPIISISSLFSSWMVIHTLFTLHYAHLFYREGANLNNNTDQGLIFPGEPEPDYIDFAYFSFVIGMTFQVSDVQIMSKKIRRLVLLHSIIAFIFNTAIVALSINIIAGVIQE